MTHDSFPAAADEGRTVFLLGGQGTQYFGMARTLLEGDEVFGSTIRRLDRLAAERCGRSVLEYLYDPSRDFGDRCDDLVMTNLGLFMIEYSLAASLAHRGITPDILIGSSLGEFIAVAVAGYLPPEDVLGFLSELSACVVREMPPGGMVAVLAEIDRFREAVRPRSDITIASVNNAQHFIISADAAGLARARRAMDAHHLLYQDLPVDYAFHSPAVEAMASAFHARGGLIQRMRFAVPEDGPRVYSSRTAAPLTTVSPEACWEVIRGPIRFTETVMAVPGHAGHRYVDLSPSSSLAAILRASLPKAVIYPVITPFHAEAQNIKRLTEGLVTRGG
ncbi:acyltransferase domain-containing protein [Streptomyces sp. 7-21]|jgi:bacillaene synthase trans-acting acyltransferase|uniref:acyltransferase domain-containing protein n=1 Tax=Streptomyces sp. 7-21 TaxID=2802283 RepID=UPI00191EABAE|nr:acyltransferase domain-containing protein [Streptomyces sp. 7-21]MBL1065933.1 acyltransferase domain-containing protein [Streptomyces sp. 7-21]